MLSTALCARTSDAMLYVLHPLRAGCSRTAHSVPPGPLAPPPAMHVFRLSPCAWLCCGPGAAPWSAVGVHWSPASMCVACLTWGPILPAPAGEWGLLVRYVAHTCVSPCARGPEWNELVAIVSCTSHCVCVFSRMCVWPLCGSVCSPACASGHCVVLWAELPNNCCCCCSLTACFPAPLSLRGCRTRRCGGRCWRYALRGNVFARARVRCQPHAPQASPAALCL